jgi:hypothetical protein
VVVIWPCFVILLKSVCLSGSMSLGRGFVFCPGPVGLESPVPGQTSPMWVGCCLLIGSSSWCGSTWPRQLANWLLVCTLLDCTPWVFGIGQLFFLSPRAVVELTYLTSRHMCRKQLSCMVCWSPWECVHACLMYMCAHVCLDAGTHAL